MFVVDADVDGVRGGGGMFVATFFGVGMAAVDAEAAIVAGHDVACGKLGAGTISPVDVGRVVAGRLRSARIGERGQKYRTGGVAFDGADGLAAGGNHVRVGDCSGIEDRLGGG